MSSCPAQTFNGVTPAVWACCKAKAQQYGVQIPGNSGTGKSHGFEVKWDYNPAAATLMLQVLDKPPIFFKCSVVNPKIKEVVDSCMTAKA